MKDRKIFCLNKINKAGLDYFRPGYEIVQDIDNCNALLVRSADMHDMVFSKELRAIARAGAGVNNIPLDRCASEGIVVFNTPGSNANAVKELVLCGLMLASRDIQGAMSWVQENCGDANIAKDAEKAKSQFAGVEIKGKTLGVIGLGAIGALVANAALKLGMQVYGYDPYLSVGAAWNLDNHVVHAEKIEELYEKCDYLTLHIPALPSTTGMINEAALASMKDGVRILNFARDVLVDDDAMAKALESGKVARYVMDFPNPKTANMKGAVVLPHLGASTMEAEDNSAVMAAMELQDYLDNGNIRNSVNFPNCDAGVCQTVHRLALLHKNIPGIIGKITQTMGEENINIDNILNKSRKEYAYTLMDLDNAMISGLVERLSAIDGMIRVRVIK